METRILKILMIITGFILCGFALFIVFGVLVYSLKEKDEGGFKLMVLPLLVLLPGIALIIRGFKYKN